VRTARLETFADGVFAIAATLLIIDVTADAPGAALGVELRHAWPQYAAYAVSFVTIGIMWVNHHACMELIERADRRFLFVNIALLACIAFVPFPTRLVAEHLRDDGLRAAALTYGLTMTATSICFFTFWFYASIGRRLIAAGADERMVQGISRAFLPGVPIYATATLAALLSPTASVILFALIAAFYVVESSAFARGA
jgi:TMEM175 potassium channel family protein